MEDLFRPLIEKRGVMFLVVPVHEALTAYLFCFITHSGYHLLVDLTIVTCYLSAINLAYGCNDVKLEDEKKTNYWTVQKVNSYGHIISALWVTAGTRQRKVR